MEHNFVDVWHADLNQDAESLSNLSSVLDEQERRKADTYELPLLRDRYVAVRTITRHVLASYLPVDPVNLQFIIGEHGKPSLNCHSMHFNISHTGNLLLIAIAYIPDIGIDIEVIKPRGNLHGMARRCFTAKELQAWRQLSTEQSVDTFYRLWTKKEAFVKAVGRGIALGLHQCEVDPQQDGQLIAIPAAYGLAGDWKVTEIPVMAGACAALITPRCEFDLRHKLFDVNQPSLKHN